MTPPEEGQPSIDARLFGSQAHVVERAMNELQLKTAAHDGAWGLGRAEWQADLQSGILTFTTESLRAECPVQVVGTHDTLEGTWLWGWDHPSVPQPLRRDAERVLAFAREHELRALTERTLPCGEADAWHFTALACHLSGAQGAYRGPAGRALVFMTFGGVKLSSNP